MTLHPITYADLPPAEAAAHLAAGWAGYEPEELAALRHVLRNCPDLVERSGGASLRVGRLFLGLYGDDDGGRAVLPYAVDLPSQSGGMCCHVGTTATRSAYRAALAELVTQAEGARQLSLFD